ncbi:MAG: roadblock/LC7 domain-containing protein [Deltaproteobacteria bacterium]|nr:roadblock/LC7 domain-containing protein [Deltaproteobacteria bacterium]
MGGQQLVLHEEEFNQLNALCDRLQRESNAKVTLIIDRNGQVVAASADAVRMDTVSLASLVAGNVAATGGLAKILGEKDFSVLFHEGEKDHLHITLIGARAVLVVIFDSRSTLGLVRLRVKKAAEEITRVFEVIVQRSGQQGAGAITEITDADIDSLFSDV